MLCNNVPTTFLAEESNPLSVSGPSELNLDTHSMHFLTEDCVTLLNDLCKAPIKRIVKQMFIINISEIYY